MDPRIQTILDDLYSVDPSLKAHEAELVNLVSALVTSRPDTQLSDEFITRLRSQLLSRAANMSASTSGASLLSDNVSFMKKMYYSLGGAVLAAAVIIPVTFYVVQYQKGPASSLVRQNDTTSDANQNALSFDVQIENVKAGAFGKLAAQVGGGYGRGGGGGGTAVSTSNESSATAPAAAPQGMGGDAKMGILPVDYVNYKYVYKGELSLTDTTVNVLKRVKSMGSLPSMSTFLKSFNIKDINLGSFGDAVVQTLGFVQDKPLGYIVYINGQEGNVSISENWERWTPCKTVPCEVPPMRVDQIPNDETVIGIANQFLKEHGVDVKNYDQPEVNSEWKLSYDRTPNKSEAWVPDVLTVTYPLKINGVTAYDDGGFKAGLRVNVNLRHMKASGLWDLNTQRYQSSSYAAETDSQALLKVVERGGMYGGFYGPEPSRTVEVELGEPTKVYLKMWNYQDGKNDELLVPALLFPVTKQPNEESFYRRSVIVPLAKDLLHMNDNNGGPVLYRDVPVTQPAQ